MKDFSYVTQSHPAYIENLYQDFVKDPQSVDADLRKFFEGFDFAINTGKFSSETVGPVFVQKDESVSSSWQEELKVYRLILGYRNKGHLIATTNPIRARKDRGAHIKLEDFGLSEWDLEQTFQVGQLIGLNNASLRAIVGKLKTYYASSVGVEYKYISDPVITKWLTEAIEQKLFQPLPLEQKRRVLEKLNQGVMFERFLHTKYVGQKRFSLEGGETTIAALDAIINAAASYDVKEVVIGMAHRGRLNVLANVLGKTYEYIFSEFEGTAKVDQTMGSGDVKYHMGYGSEVKTDHEKTISLKLMPNPSHLEAVNPVVLGFSRAKADVMHGSNFNQILPILIHGDASIAGQGIVYEVLQMCNLEGYHTGGTLHFIINNQIGFTTDFEDARSSDYCTSLAAAIQAPVFHVNGDDPEAVVRCVEIATAYRQQFHQDVFIDMVCYRRHGHNEGDDPKFTQPHLYQLIEKHANPREIYINSLLQKGGEELQSLAREMEKKFWQDLQERLDEVKQNPLPYHYQPPELEWKKLRRATAADFVSSPDTSVTAAAIKEMLGALLTWPADFKPLRKVEKILQEKTKLLEQESKIDWATAELLAYASLLREGKDVRLSGQDVRRGTFSHRHAVLRDENNDKPYNRLSAIPGATGQFRIYNSLLSEYGVLGFEYGYALANPQTLVVWEAQFGDFANGAQTLIDQFIAAGEQKWNRMNGVTLLLPHGYEGQGPEHSSARLERFLQLAAELNIVVTNVTTAANLFHLLRRQLLWPFRKPLINFSPKANLRYSGTYSALELFTQGKFQEVIDDVLADPSQIKKVLLCSGKIYFELLEKRNQEARKDLAIVRLEQLYPLPINQLENLQQRYAGATWFWVQEEPQNMGAAAYLKMQWRGINFGVVSRHPSASTATGYNKIHIKEQAELIETAFTI
ncbi:MAG: 2-oxoglutarate dehydrogenase E1 component [Bacteroidetes bacterium]|nr:2-oxoglutarate dehydrogenase E1 component [Bacteroidota bacterium]